MPSEPEEPDELDPGPEANEDSDQDEKVSFTEEELREMEAAGLTLGDAIRAIESRLG